MKGKTLIGLISVYALGGMIGLTSSTGLKFHDSFEKYGFVFVQCAIIWMTGRWIEKP